jgi:LuxR family maltose regulon positive regulatory protein
LNEGLGRKLTLVSAPAGFGKTTLVAEWLDNLKAAGGAGRPFTWLSLDENDNDPARFVTYLLAALQNVAPEIGQAAQAMLQAPQPPPPQSWLTSLINDIAATPQPFVLVLDDYHLIHTLAIHQQLAFLLEHQPPQIHLAIVTREDPPLPLARWRARGQTVEIRQADLRFTERETVDFMRQAMQLDLSAADVAALQRRTEGWVAGLQLAALSLQGRDDAHQLVQSFTGSHRYILDYLIEEVFQQQTAEVRDFLLKTSILDRFCAALCDAVCFAETDSAERAASRAMLLSLDQANLFIVPLDQSRGWYRYHRLFADLLRQRLRTVGVPEPVSLLHERASRWYQAHGFPADAVRHALAASDWEQAAALILAGDETMLKRGEVVTLLGWFRALPDEVVDADPALCNAFSWPLILTEQLDAAESYLARAEQIVQERGGGDKSFLGETAVARAHIARARGDSRRAIELSERALALLSPEDFSARSIVALNLGIAQWHSGRLAEAERALAEAQHAASRSGNDYVRCAALVFLSRAQQARGKLRQAGAACRQIVAQGGQLPITALAHYDLGRLHYEWNDLAQAAGHLQQGLELSQRGGGVEFLFSGYTTLALVRQAQGAAAEARAALHQAEQLIEHPGISPGTHLYHLALRILVALAQDDLETASLAAEAAPELENAGSFPDYLFLMLARVRLLLAQQRQADARERAVALQEMSKRSGWQSIALQARTLQALAAPTPDEALNVLSAALTLAEPEGYTRTFVDTGPAMEQLLRRALSNGITPAYTSKLLAAFGQVALPPSRPSAPSLVEPLSERELDVLRLLAAGQTNQEIAVALHVSINTVKTHLKNIYGKLGTNNRRAAAAQAKKLGLIP